MRLNRADSNVRVFLDRSTIPIFRGMEIAKSLITFADYFSEISSVQ